MAEAICLLLLLFSKTLPTPLNFIDLIHSKMIRRQLFVTMCGYPEYTTA